MNLEIGAGEKPHPDYDLHTDILPLPDIDVVCRLDALPFADGTLDSLRANHVLEHQSWELVERTVTEWVRVVRPGGRIEVAVPDALLLARQWASGEITTREANYWILGGHSDRDAHRGVDGNGVPLWIWNAHHTLFDAGSLASLLQSCGVEGVRVDPYAERNLRATGYRSPVVDKRKLEWYLVR